MASALSPAINALKYAKLRLNNNGVWGVPKEVWVNDTGTFKEPKEIWANKDGTWTRVTTALRYMKFNGSSSFLNCGTNSFNNYIDGTTQCYYEFSVILTSLSAVQTLFSYGSSTSYCTIEVGTDGKVYVKTRFDSGTSWSVNHATALSVDTWYKIRVEFTSTVGIKIYAYDGSTVGTNFSSGNVSFNLTTATKFIGKRYDSANYFSGYLMNVNMFGGTYSGTDYRHDAGSYSGSTVGSSTVTDTYTTDGSQNLSGTDVVVATTG